MNITISIQVFMSLIFILLIVSNRFDVREKNNANLLMDVMFLCGFLKVFCSMGSTVLQGKAELSFLKAIFTAGDFGLGIPMLVLLLFYAVKISNEKNTISNFTLKLIFISCFVLNLFVIASIFKPILFSCKNGIYKPGPLFAIFHIMLAIIMIAEIIILSFHKSQFSKRQFFALIFYILMPLFGSILKIFVDKNIEIGNMSITLGILIVYITSHIERGQIIAKNEKEMNDARTSLMLSQIQPHFLYNSLNTIQYLCNTNSEDASIAINRFSKYLRTNMDSLNQKKPIPLKDDIAHLNNYLSFERLRFPDIEINFDIQCLSFNVPTLTLQPIVENAVNHGVRQLEKGGQIDISSWDDKMFYYISVKDNGPGFDVNAKPIKDGRNHVGIANTRSRIKTMCGGTLNIESEKAKGTIVTIKIPKETENENHCS